MFVYWGIFLVLSLGALLSQGQYSDRKRLLFVLVASVPTAMMIGLRWKIGPDWPAYAAIYKYANLYSLAENLQREDPAFKALNWALRNWRAPFWVLNMVCGAIFVAGLTAFCRRQPNPWLAYLIAFPYLVVVVAMSGDRQSVALGLMLFALNAYEDGRLYRFVTLLLAASLFHGSVLLMLPLCLLSHSTNLIQRVLVMLAIVALGFYFFSDTFGTYAHRYSLERIQSSGVTLRLAMNSMAALLFLSFGRRFDLDEHAYSLWRNLALCTLALIPLMAIIPSSTAIDRFLLYLFPLQFLVLGRIPIALAEKGQMRLLLTAMVVLYSAAVQVTYLSVATFARYYVPYRSIFEQ